MDYVTWKSSYQDSDRRSGTGLKEVPVGPGVMDPNSALVMLEGENSAEVMLSDPDLKSKMEAAGVVDFNYAVV